MANELNSEAALIPRKGPYQRWATPIVKTAPAALQLAATSTGAEGVHQIRFLQQDRALQTEADETVLEAGLREDVALEFSCTLGGCGTCRVKLVSGQVDMVEPNCLSDEEIAEGYILACSSKPVTALDIDA